MSTERDDLPIPDFEHLAIGDLTHRVRSLDADGVRRLVDAEEARGRRAPVLQVLHARLDQLEAGAEPSGGDPARAVDDLAPPPSSPGPVTGPTDAPKINPPSHGDPTNPAQPR